MRTLARAGWLFGPTLTRFRGVVVAASITVGLFTGALAAATAAADAQVDRPDGLGAQALRSVEFGSYGSSTTPTPLTSAAITDAGRLAHVTQISGWTQTNIALFQKEGGPMAGLALTTRTPAIQPALTQGSEPHTAGEVVVGASTLRALKARVGDTVGFEHVKRALDGNGDGTGVDSRIRIVGVYDDTMPSLDVPGTAYGASDLLRLVIADDRGRSTLWYDQNYVYPKAYALADAASSLETVISEARAAGYNASSFASLLTGLSTTQQLLQSVSAIAAVVLCAILTILAWILGSAILTTRRGSIGLLIALGWTRRQVVGTFILILTGIGGIVGAAGILSGALITTAAGMLLGAGFPANWPVFLVSGLVIPVLVFGISPLIPIMRLARTSPDVTLRERAEP